jgi:hypothetical protein
MYLLFGLHAGEFYVLARGVKGTCFLQEPSSCKRNSLGTKEKGIWQRFLFAGFLSWRIPGTGQKKGMKKECKPSIVALHSHTL